MTQQIKAGNIARKAKGSHNSPFQAKPRKKMCRLRLRAQDDLGTSGCNEGFQIGDLMIFNLFDVFFRTFFGSDLVRFVGWFRHPSRGGSWPGPGCLCRRCSGHRQFSTSTVRQGNSVMGEVGGMGIIGIYWVLPKIGVLNPPKWMVKIMENPKTLLNMG